MRGWASYYKMSDAVGIGEFSRQDKLTFLKLRRWAFRRQGNTNYRKMKYWRTLGNNNWIFATRGREANTLRLLLHNEFSSSSTNYVKVKGEKSPYDGDSVYSSTRLGRHPELPSRKVKLLQQQKGKCPWCGLGFLEWDVMEVDRKVPRSLGGKDEWKNLQLLHRHCHDEKTAIDLIATRKKEHSKFLKELAQQWEKVDWEWSNDIPVIKSQTVKKSHSDKGNTLSSRMKRNFHVRFRRRGVGW
ncbi:HNH endonuclease [Microseira sp. BLCC-F43]|uniref:HNH endonuclease n=1 Tax=Microseira sp. BLCC-F43 TaxID=3153602 RepID=UPI0035B9650B